VDRSTGGSPTVDEARFGAYVEMLRSLRARFNLAGDVDLGTVLRMPEVMQSTAEDGDGDSAELLAVIERAADALTRAKEEEGTRLVLYLHERLARIETALEAIATRAPERLVEQRARLRENVRQLVEGLAVDEQRIAMEIAMLADRVDVQEELSRFQSHIKAFRHALAQGGAEPVGKRLGFLLQEMLREANTTGSKANDSAILADVVTIKEELERIREQVENLE
jgi:uncharacterized protein (TIGR00255 family)